MKIDSWSFLFPLALVLAGCACNTGPGVPTGVLEQPYQMTNPLRVGENRVTGGPRNSIVVTAIVTPFIPGANNFDTAFGEIDKSGPPRLSYLSGVKISWSGGALILPKEALRSLVEPHWLRIATERESTYVIFEGLDAGDAYAAIFTIRHGLLIERLVAQGEFRHEVWERTIYHDDFLEHPERYKNM